MIPKKKKPEKRIQFTMRASESFIKQLKALSGAVGSSMSYYLKRLVQAEYDKKAGSK